MIDWTGSPPFGRRTSLMHTLELLDARREPRPGAVPLIVEIGTSESYNPDGLGNALLAFAWYAGQYGARVKSVDVSPGAVANSRKMLEQFIPQHAWLPEITCDDAYGWVTELHERIDLLYVDAGFELICDPNYRAYAIRHAAVIPPFYVELYKRFPAECFEPGCLMLFDDTDPQTYWGKGIDLIPHLLANGWHQLSLRGEPVFPMALLERL